MSRWDELYEMVTFTARGTNTIHIEVPCCRVCGSLVGNRLAHNDMCTGYSAAGPGTGTGTAARGEKP